MLDLLSVEIAIGEELLQLDTHKVVTLVIITNHTVHRAQVELEAILTAIEAQMDAQVTA
jgi:hypothetical protein